MSFSSPQFCHNKVAFPLRNFEKDSLRERGEDETEYVFVLYKAKHKAKDKETTMSIYSYSLKSHLSVRARAPHKPREFNENASGKKKTLYALKVIIFQLLCTTGIHFLSF